jgi:hypothetical protein
MRNRLKSFDPAAGPVEPPGPPGVLLEKNTEKKLLLSSEDDHGETSQLYIS